MYADRQAIASTGVRFSGAGSGAANSSRQEGDAAPPGRNQRFDFGSRRAYVGLAEIAVVRQQCFGRAELSDKASILSSIGTIFFLSLGA